MRAKKSTLLIVICCAAVLLAAAVTVILLTRNAGGTNQPAAFTRSAEEAGMTVEYGLTAENFSDNPSVTAWLEKCNSPGRDEQDAYALCYTDTAPDGTVSCTWLILRRGTDTPVGQPGVTVSENRDGAVTVTVAYGEDGEVIRDSLCRVSGTFESEPELEIDGILGLIVSVTNEPF